MKLAFVFLVVFLATSYQQRRRRGNILPEEIQHNQMFWIPISMMPMNINLIGPFILDYIWRRSKFLGKSSSASRTCMVYIITYIEFFNEFNDPSGTCGNIYLQFITQNKSD